MVRPLTALTDMAAALRAGEVSSQELVRLAIAKAESLDPVLGTFITRLPEQALTAARQVDDARVHGHDLGPLAGIPLGIKDCIATRETATTAQSLVHDPAWWHGRDAAVVSRLRAAGAIVVGKTTMTEHALGRPDPARPFPVPRNPWDLDRWPGGSSTGTANGIAAGIFPAGLGTDTAGSCRIPAAMCGLTGLKTTYRLVPTDGCLPAARSFDTIGPLGRTARDCAALLAASADQRHWNTDSSDTAWDSLRGIHIGVPWALLEDPARHVAATCLSTFRRAVGELASRGARIHDIDLPEFDELSAAGAIMLVGEAFAAHQARFRHRWHDYGRPFRRAVGLGALLPAWLYLHAQGMSRALTDRVLERMDHLDAIATPTWASGAPRYQTNAGIPANELNLTLVWNPTGFPALALPMGFDHDHLPLSLQLIGRPFTETRLLAIGDVYQQSATWHEKFPVVDATVTPEPVPDPDDEPADGADVVVSAARVREALATDPEPTDHDIHAISVGISRLIQAAGQLGHGWLENLLPNPAGPRSTPATMTRPPSAEKDHVSKHATQRGGGTLESCAGRARRRYPG